ncbi:MAG TPA: hypothetical protein G4N94_04060 [Caldilineae bacterium]|nr:hypothetical protein [Caldilineae bacterium]
MGYQPLPQKQLFTVRQIVAAISIIACLVFIISYSGRIIMDRKVQARQEKLEQGVEEAKAFGATIKDMIAHIDDQDIVEPYARNERGMQQPGEQTVAQLLMEQVPSAAAEQDAAVETEVQDEENVPNWRLWWDFVITGGNKQ